MEDNVEEYGMIKQMRREFLLGIEHNNANSQYPINI